MTTRKYLSITLIVLDQSYFDRFTIPQIKGHLEGVCSLIKDQTTQINFNRVDPSNESELCLSLTFVSYDSPWIITAISGLFAIHNFDIRKGHIYTYQDSMEESHKHNYYLLRNKVIDVF